MLEEGLNPFVTVKVTSQLPTLVELRVATLDVVGPDGATEQPDAPLLAEDTALQD